MLETEYTLTTSALAFGAAEQLRRAQQLLNAADGSFASGSNDYPYGATEIALRRTLEAMVGLDEDSSRAEAFAEFVIDQAIDNGENIEYQITKVLGWNLLLTTNDTIEGLSAYPQYPETAVAASKVHYRHLAPKILGGDR